MSRMMVPLDCAQVAQGSFLRRKSEQRCLERGEERGCGLKDQQAGNVCGAGTIQAPGRLLSFSLWYTSLEHLRARGTLLSGTVLRTSACAELTTMLRGGLVQQSSGHKDADPGN